jgi:hypothetical protein
MSNAHNTSDDIVDKVTDLSSGDIPTDEPSVVPDTDTTCTAAIIKDSASLTSSSSSSPLDNTSPDEKSADLPEYDVLIEPPAPAELKPNIATISAIVNEVRRQRKSGADIASIASREVDRIYDDGNEQVEFDGDPLEQESYALYNRKVKGGKWSSTKYADDVESNMVHNKPSSFTSDKAAEAVSIIDDFSDLCEELGIRDISHPQLLRTTRRRYQILPVSLVSSTICHYCTIITCLAGIALIVASAVTKGFDHVKKRNHALHPAWIQEEPKTKVEKAWWVADNGEEDEPHDPLGSSKIDNSKRLSPDELEQFSYSLSDAYLPIWFDQSTGWKGSSYEEAVAFCKSHYNFVPCPYEV